MVAFALMENEGLLLRVKELWVIRIQQENDIAGKTIYRLGLRQCFVKQNKTKVYVCVCTHV